MEKVIQDKETLLNNLSILETEWMDDFAIEVIDFLNEININNIDYDNNQLIQLLDKNFEIASTVFRLFLEQSKDEYTSTLKNIMPEKGMSGKKGFIKDKLAYVKALNKLLLQEKMIETINKEYDWKDIIIERLKGGRGSAIKGQKRGRQLEDFVEQIIVKVFNKSYDVRCSFTGLKGDSSAKADFAIPSKEDPQIIIEVKGYGATGSKQTDVIGDVNKIKEEKRHDSVFLLFTDGITWQERESDFRKLIEYQNHGFIYKIYTKKMYDEFLNDLKLLKTEKNIT